MPKVLIFLGFLLASAIANNPCENRHLEFVNDYAGCGRYFSCINGFPHPLECPNGAWFHESACHAPESVPCERCPSEGVFAFGTPNSCVEYTLCINGIALERECAPGTRFDRIQERCAPRESVQCDYLRCPESGRVIVADPSNCQGYLVCDYGDEVARRECSSGLLFDPELGSCSRSENVQCIQSGTAVGLKIRSLVDDIPTAPTVERTVPPPRAPHVTRTS